jgi:hypothetical protein
MVIQTDEQSVLVGINGRVPLSVPRQAITQLEVSTGRERQAFHGMLIGAGIGALVGATGCLPAVGCGHPSAEDVLGSAAGGALYGAAIGALVKRDHWSAVPLDQVRVSIGPTRARGVRLSLSVAF